MTVIVLSRQIPRGIYIYSNKQKRSVLRVVVSLALQLNNDVFTSSRNKLLSYLVVAESQVVSQQTDDRAWSRHSVLIYTNRNGGSRNADATPSVKM